MSTSNGSTEMGFRNWRESRRLRNPISMKLSPMTIPLDFFSFSRAQTDNLLNFLAGKSIGNGERLVTLWKSNVLSRKKLVWLCNEHFSINSLFN